MPLAAYVMGAIAVVVILFGLARLVFGPVGAVMLGGVVGGCFAGPPGIGVGLIVGVVVVPILELVAFAVEPSNPKR